MSNQFYEELKRRQRFEKMREQLLELYDVKAEHGISFLKDLIYPIDDHVLQCAVMFLTKELSSESIVINMKNIKTENDEAYISFITKGILLLKEGHKRTFIEKELQKEINSIFS